MTGDPGNQAPVLVTGGAGFIGSALVRHLRAAGRPVVNVDALTYAAVPGALAALDGDAGHTFVQADVTDPRAMRETLTAHRPAAIVHLAAETHVDRSIDQPAGFVQTNVVGTQSLLDAALAYWRGLDADARAAFRVHHVSTDEVYGALGPTGAFTETTPYAPNSPYAASKAGSDHLVRAWQTTYGLPTLISNCSNNYGPFQFPEKLIPLTLLNALEDREIPVYGDGAQVRDWLHVDDHCRALTTILAHGAPGRTYNVGGASERTNLEIVRRICDLLDARRPRGDGTSRRELITFVADRPGHDRRYAIDATRLRAELGWRPAHDLDSGLSQTVDWYLDNAAWWRPIRAGVYAGERLGTAEGGAG